MPLVTDQETGFENSCGDDEKILVTRSFPAVFFALKDSRFELHFIYHLQMLSIWEE